MWKVRELADKVTNVVMNYTEIEAKVREATNDEAWGPTGTMKHELSQATFSYDQFPEVMGMLWKRIAENKRSPRRIYKSLLLLHHLLLNGSDRVIRATQDRIYELRSLTEYHVVYEPGFSINSIIPPEVTKDGEMNVRVKAKEIVELVQDEEKLREDRKKAKKNRDKYVGIGSDRMMSTSRWGSTGSDFDDVGEELGRPKSPQFSTPSPKKDSTRKIVFNETKSSNGEDDFNPREGEDFGDFKTASSSNAAKVTAGGVGSGDDFFAVDFQAAFGAGGTSSSGGSTAQSKTQPLIGEVKALSLPTTNPSLSLPLTTNEATNSDNQMDLLGLGGLEFNNSQQLFQQSFDSILQPVMKSNVQSNNINNNSAIPNKQSTSLQGTTWSDLNFSIDDLTINPASRNQTNKLSMNQLKSMNK
ncbi:unnamed protein product [Allacma fusca]|uniref:ENTH domain-containing protein n=1 Tax=Allacma fusca TaxID=39272 RepID=A0A8J2NW84_9HEXA|nr:unnamed protein product [Allacma fusca]